MGCVTTVNNRCGCDSEKLNNLVIRDIIKIELMKNNLLLREEILESLTTIDSEVKTLNTLTLESNAKLDTLLAKP